MNYLNLSTDENQHIEHSLISLFNNFAFTFGKSEKFLIILRSFKFWHIFKNFIRFISTKLA